MDLRQFIVRLSIPIALLGLYHQPANAGPPSFDCNKAQSIEEHLICSVPALGDADAKMASVYHQAMGGSSIPDRENLQADQISWLHGRGQDCGIQRDVDPRGVVRQAIVACLLQSFRTRTNLLRRIAEAGSPGGPGSTSVPSATITDPGEPSRSITSARSNLETSRIRRAPESAPHQGVSEEISTQFGAVTKQWVCADFGSCEAIYINKTEIVRNDHTALVGSFPPGPYPRYVVFEESCGGNMCHVLPSIIDLSVSPPWIIKSIPLRSYSLSIFEENDILEIKGIAAGETNRLGDPIEVSYQAYPKRRITLRKPFEPTMHFETLFSESGGTTPDVLLSDAIIRKPLVNLLGQDFKRLREQTVIGKSIELLDYRFIVGSGCRPHFCDESEGFFIIDIATGRTSAAWTDLEEGSKNIVKGAGDKWRQDGDGAAHSARVDWFKRHGVELKD